MKENLTFKEHVYLLLIGFTLTILVGGALSKYFDHLTLKNKQKEIKLQINQKLYEDISHTLDKRLYRTRLLLWSLQDRFTDKERITRLNLYKETLREWNENLNKNLAIIEINSGKKLRKEFDDIRREFKNNGAKIEKLYNKKQKNISINIKEIEESLDELNIKIYFYNLKFLEEIKKG